MLLQRICNYLACCAVLSLVCCLGCGSGDSPPSRSSSGGQDSAGGDTGGATPPAESGGGASASTGGWGHLIGRFVFDGTAPTPSALSITKDEEFCGPHNLTDESLLVGDDGGVANVVVYVRTKDVAVHPDIDTAATAEIMLDNKNCRFEPHVLPIWFDRQTLVIHNSDPVGHNSNLSPLGDVGINPLLGAGGEPVKHTFGRKQSIPVPVSCNIHPWMKGYVLPRDNPYVAVSGADGSFKIENLPSGELEFVAWQEKAGWLEVRGWKKGRFTENIVDTETNDLGDIKLAPALFEK